MAETTTTTATEPAPASTSTPAPAPTSAPASAPAPFPPGRFMAAPADLPPKYTSPKSYWITKLAGRIISILCSIIAIGLGAGSMADVRIERLYIVAILPACVVCIAWDIAEIACIVKRGGNRGIHPGAIVGVDLFIWLGLVFLSLLCISFSFASARYRISGNSRSYDYRTGRYISSIDLDTPEYQALLTKMNGLSRALAAFFCFLTLTHFGLFVIGCAETNIRNKQPKMVYVMAPPQFGYVAPGPPPGVLPAPYGAPMMPMQPQSVPMMPMQPGPVYAGEPKPPVVAGVERYA